MPLNNCPHCGSDIGKLQWYIDTKLTKREQEILSHRTFAPKEFKWTYAQLGEILGISAQRVQQIEKKALEKARTFAEREWPDE